MHEDVKEQRKAVELRGDIIELCSKVDYLVEKIQASPVKRSRNERLLEDLKRVQEDLYQARDHARQFGPLTEL